MITGAKENMSKKTVYMGYTFWGTKTLPAFMQKNLFCIPVSVSFW